MGRRCGRRCGGAAAPGARLGGSAGSLAELAAAVRGSAVRVAAEQARQLRLVAELADRCEAAALGELAGGPRVPGQPLLGEVADSAMTGEVMVVLGIGRGLAQRLVWLARRLTHVLPEALGALAGGRVDLPRVRALAVATVVVADPGAARRRRVERVAQRAVSAWPNGDGTGSLFLTAADCDIVLVDGVITDVAHAWPATGPDGEPLGMDQRRVDAFVEVFRRIRDGGHTPGVGVRREREVGLVLHAGTLFGDGPAAGAPGQLRGVGAPAPVDPVTAAALARAEIDRGVGVQVLVTGPGGVLERWSGYPVCPRGGPGKGWWARSAPRGRVYQGWPPTPTPPRPASAEQVRAAQPCCVAYDCARMSRRCDLDHVREWPRGPTSAATMIPRCRRHHEHKTRRLVHTVLHPDGSLDTRMLTGIVARTKPEPLPGHGPGEGYRPG